MKRLFRFIGLQPATTTHSKEFNHHVIDPISPWENPKLTETSCNNLPSYFRSFTRYLPNTPELEKDCLMPLGIVIDPGRVTNVPMIDFSHTEIPRCSKCSAYLSCFCTLSYDQRSWKCAICGNTTKFTPRYLRNYSNFKELTCSVYDMKAPRSYIKRPQIMKSFLFIIDISENAILSGFTKQFIQTLKITIEKLPDSTSISLVTSGNFVSVFDIQNMKETIIPDPIGFVGTPNYIPLLGNVREKLMILFDKLLLRQPTSKINGFGSALSVAGSILRVYGGVIVASCCGCPNSGPLAVQSRIETNPTISEKELLNISPGDEIGEKFSKLSLKLNRRGISVHLFAYSTSHTEIAIIGAVCGLTGGKCHFYNNFDPVKLNNDLFYTMIDRYKWNCSMKFRCSPGIQIRKTFGNLTNQDETAYFPILTSDAAITFALTITQPITNAIFQAALLWSMGPSHYYVRIFNFSIPIACSIPQMMKSLDELALTAFFAKHSVTCLLNSGKAKASSELMWLLTELAKRGAEFHSMYSIVHALSQNEIISNSSFDLIDARIANVLNIRMMSAIDCLLFIYPRLIDLKTYNVLRLRKQNICDGVFALHEHNRFVVWGYPQQNSDLIPTIVNSKEFVGKTEKMMNISGKYLPVEILNSNEGNLYATKRMYEDGGPKNFDDWMNDLKMVSQH